MPHDLRRWGFALAQPRRFRRYQLSRTKANRWGYSFQQFDRQQAILIHIPKAAGISVTQALFGCKAAGRHAAGVNQMVFSQADYNRDFKFTIVRNPWDRLLSAYTFLRQGGMTDHDKSWAAEHVLPYRDFNHFVEEGLNRPAVRGWTHFRPQLSFLPSYPGAEITLDFVGRFERLEEDVSHIGEHLSSRFIPRSNAAIRPGPSAYPTSGNSLGSRRLESAPYGSVASRKRCEAARPRPILLGGALNKKPWGVNANRWEYA